METPTEPAVQGQPKEPEPTVTKPEPTWEAPKTDDLLTRVSEFAKNNEEQATQEVEVKGEFDFKEIEAIQDPTAKEIAMKAYKSMQSHFTKGYQDISALRKEMEQARESGNTWTPERVQKLVEDPTFVQAAQQVASQPAMSQEEYSALSDAEKAKIKGMESELQALKQQTLNANKQQQDAALQQKYPNYNPQAIDTLTAELLEGKRQATREDLYKVHSFEKSIQNAYEMGMKDAREGNVERINSMSTPATTTIATESNTPLERGENETNKAYAKRSFKNSLGRILGKQA
jgi:hypothetical protein